MGRRLRSSKKTVGECEGQPSSVDRSVSIQAKTLVTPVRPVSDVMIDSEAFRLPNKAFFTLKEVCALKGLNYKTACNKRTLQPNKGIPDGPLGGRKVWSYETIAVWITELDDKGLNEGTEGSIPKRRVGLAQSVVAKSEKAS